MNGFRGLLEKEIVRFWRVAFQTIAAPVLTTFLYLLVFSHILSEKVYVFEGVSYVEFLIPGLVMMSVLQNSFANSSSSLIQSKVTGNLLLIVLPPISPLAFFNAYVCASVIRGLLIGAGVLATGIFFVPTLTPASPFLLLLFAVLGGIMTGALGIIAGLWAEKFDQLGMFQNFIIMPLTFLSGVFYSIQSLPDFWRGLSSFNPFLYMIDGFRRGFFAQGDIPLTTSLLVTVTLTIAVSWLALHLVRTGYKIKT
ncbi:ABC transporter permease [Candidatus Persebacteraceae bacterium Df01]|jgi:ABC-2 type transport system permease protein|uniref:Transport permease protein n=1 Tax=Candidatus Doriopsillibacter californiensis TaxID=2970740 RepID=A0ABT7QLD6_9GAMM|nr:ABC transporter permease [Candidatus Persebacteraceae bacterium Df01]